MYWRNVTPWIYLQVPMTIFEGHSLEIRMHILKVMIAVLIVVLGNTSIAANTTQLKIATIYPESHSLMKDLRAGGKRINERTEGRVKLKFYSGGSQGTSSAKVLSKIQIRQLHGSDFSPTDLQSKYSDLTIYGLPFVFESWEEVRHVREQMDHKLQKGIEDAGFVAFGFAGSFAIILSNKPVRSHEDLRGKKVWLPQGDLIGYEAMKKLKLSPVPKPPTDVLTGLQTGLLEIVMMPPEAAVALQWHTKVKYLTQVPIVYAMTFLAIEKRAFERLDPHDQEIVREVFSDIYAKTDAKSQEESLEATETLTKFGITRVELNSGEFAKLRKVMEENNRGMAKKGVFSLELYEEMQDHIQAYRQEKDLRDKLACQPSEKAETEQVAKETDSCEQDVAEQAVSTTG